MTFAHLLLLHLPPLLLILVCVRGLASFHIWCIPIRPIGLPALAFPVLPQPSYLCSQAVHVAFHPLDKAPAFPYFVVAEPPSVA